MTILLRNYRRGCCRQPLITSCRSPTVTQRDVVRGIEDVSTSSGAEREPYGGDTCLWALVDQLLCGLLRRLLVVGQWPDGGGQQCAVRDVQQAVLGRQRRVEQPDRGHGAVQGAAQCTGADPYLFPRDVRAGEEQHEAGEHVGQGLLCGNAENHAGDRTADQKVPDW